VSNVSRLLLKGKGEWKDAGQARAKVTNVGGKVLLATENRVYDGIIRRYLSLGNWELSVESDVLQIPERVEELQPDVMLLQAQLARTTGFEVCRMLTGAFSGKRLPVVIFSTEEDGRLMARLAGAAGFLKVPFSEEELLALLEKVVLKRDSILLVDDSVTIHRAVAEILGDLHYEIHHAYDGVAALEWLENNSADLVISDLEMPRMNGYELCCAIKSNPALNAVPVLVQSSLNSGIDIDRSFAAGADDYISKPIVAEELQNRVNLMLPHNRIYRQETILVVDDSVLVRNMVGQSLGQQGFGVILAGHGAEALRYLESQPVTLILTDNEMPVMDGMELVRRTRCRAGFERIPIIMLSSRDSKVERAKGRVAGVNEYISKPFVADKLLVSVERLLAAYRMEQEKDVMRLYLSDAAVEHAARHAEKKTSLYVPMRAREQSLTIIFADIVGFSALCEKMPAREVVDLLNTYFDGMVQILKRHRGAIDKFIGDSILALFPGNRDGTLDAVRACEEMLHGLREFNIGRAEAVKMRVGINTGTVMLGDLGSKFYRREFTVIGDPVNLAQRLESKAPPGGILLSDSTYQLVKSAVVVESKAPVAVKGKEEWVRTHLFIAFKTDEERDSDA
jgi:DNA-binding response OmpR family regulator